MRINYRKVKKTLILASIAIALLHNQAYQINADQQKSTPQELISKDLIKLANVATNSERYQEVEYGNEEIILLSLEEEVKSEIISKLSDVELKLPSKYSAVNGFTGEEMEILYKIATAEAGNQGRKGVILVVNVIMNRINSSNFPNTVEEVVFAGNGKQFNPIRDGSYEKAEPAYPLIDWVNDAVNGEDYSEGALYFMAEEYSSEKNIAWFYKSTTKLFTYGDHTFFK